MFVGVCFSALGQNLNGYKYVQVPEKFDFLKESNQYQLNELTKFLFEKHGFKALTINDEKPADFGEACNLLHANVKEYGGLFTTILQVELRDCRSQIIYTSEEGKSKEKDYKKAYQEALRDAFSSVEALNYKYDEDVSLSSKENLSESTENKIDTGAAKDQIAEIKEVIVTSIPKEVKEVVKTIAPISNKKHFVSADSAFYLLSTEFGFQLYQSEMEEPFAKLIKTKSLNNFIYLSLQNTGIAYFDELGNLKVEVLNSKDNSTSIKNYKLKD